MTDRLLTVTEARTFLGVSRSQFYRLLDDPSSGLAAIVGRVGARPRVSAAALAGWWERRCRSTARPSVR